MFYEDISSWGGDLPLGLFTDVGWWPTWPYKGIGDRTAPSLAEEWFEVKGRTYLNWHIGAAYHVIQVILDAVERAGTLDKEEVNKAIAATDATFMCGRVKFTETHDSPPPFVMAQWFKTDKPWVWERKIVHSDHPDIPVEAEPIFPLPPL
jgi:branched-chain amino acid transport system substrate-binding protein